jgi:hypothetical protein
MISYIQRNYKTFEDSPTIHSDSGNSPPDRGVLLFIPYD